MVAMALRLTPTTPTWTRALTSRLLSTTNTNTNRSKVEEEGESTVTRAELEDDPHVNAVFHALTRCPPSDPQSIARSLSSLPFLLTSPILDRVLLRLRFSHSNPLLSLHLFLLSSLRRGFCPSPLSLRTTLYILSRSRLLPLSLSLLRFARRRLPDPDLLLSPATLHVLLSRLAKVASPRLVIVTFLRCRPLFRPFSTPHFNALLRALSQEHSMPAARRAFHLLKHRFPPDLVTFNTLLSGWKYPSDASAFFQEMLSLRVLPDIVSYNSLIHCHCKHRELDAALELVSKMREDGIDPDVITYTCLIGGMGLVGRPDRARAMLKEMREYGCYPDTAAYNAAIRNFCIARRIGDAFELMEEMREKGNVRPNATTFNLFFRCFYWSNELKHAWELYNGMRKRDRCLPNTQTCMFLVRMFRRHERADMAMELWEDMLSEGFGSLELVSDVLFDLLCDIGKVVEAEGCFLQMVDRGHKPSMVSFKRIKVLMELAKMHDSINKLEEKMASFRSRASQPSKSEISDIDIESLMKRLHTT